MKNRNLISNLSAFAYLALGVSATSCISTNSGQGAGQGGTVPGCNSNGQGIGNNPHCSATVLPVNDTLLDPTFSVMGPYVSDNMPFGARLAFANLTSDGYADLAVYSLNYVNGVESGTSANVIVYSGKDHSVLQTLSGNHYFGRSIASAGNFNHDGVDDLIIGAPSGPNNGVPGAAYVYSGTDYSLIYSMTGAMNSMVGWVVASAGDVNGDGYDDVIITDPGYSNNRGIVYVVSGKDHSILFSVTGENAGDYFGQSAASAGDIDGDGLPDIVIGTRDFQGQMPGTQLTGKVYVYSPASGRLIWSKQGLPFEGLGIGVAAAGDFNRDSVPDLIVQSGISNIIYVLSGKDGSVLYQQASVEPFYFGLNTAGIGDINGDGYADIAIGNWMTGNVQIVSGKTASVALTITPNPQDILGSLGAIVVSGKNFNGDGQSNLALAAINARLSASDGNPRGKFYVISAEGAMK